MPKPYVTILGKAVRVASKLRGGGSALPGLIVEKIDPNFIKHSLSNLSYGVVVISGTNGKTTTTKMAKRLIAPSSLDLKSKNLKRFLKKNLRQNESLNEICFNPYGHNILNILFTRQLLFY